MGAESPAAVGTTGSHDGTPLPLSGVRVLDLSRMAPGLFCTMLLGDLGADVVTVEAPVASRPYAHLAHLPLFGALQARASGRNQHWRSRRSIVLDLKSEGGLGVVRNLASKADVFVEGFRPGTCARLGVDYETLSADNPRLVYCSISGYGQTGALAHRVGHDLNYIAEAGLLSVLVRDGDPPGIPLNVVGDIAAGGLLPAFAILAALMNRDRTGRGSYLDMSIHEGLLAMLAGAASWEPDGSWGNGMLAGATPFYDCYRTADGRLLSIAALEPKFFRSLCEAVGDAELVGWQDKVEDWTELRKRLAARFAQATLAEWMSRLEEFDVPVAPVNSLAEAFDNGRQSGRVTGAFRVMPLHSLHSMNADSPISTMPGEHTTEVLLDAGFGQDYIDDLLVSGGAVQAHKNGD